jgi:hypothetical protein
MEKDIKITLENGVKELVIREGEAAKIHIPSGIVLKDLTIGAVAEYLLKDGILNDEIKNSFVLFSYEDKFIQLKFASRIENPDDITGKVSLHPDLKKFEINEGKRYTAFKLADFIRMNRHFFETKDQAIKLENILRNFTAEVDRKIEASDDKRANVKASIIQQVKTNIPESFTLLLPVFVGSTPIPVKVEIDIDSSDISCSLMSPDLKELIDVETKAIIDVELKNIQTLYPQLRIFQK